MPNANATVTYSALPRSFRLAQAQHLCRTYQVLLTDLVARPSVDEWIFTRFLDCPTSQYCNSLQKPMNSPTRPDRDNRVDAREGAWSSLESAIYALRYERWRNRRTMHQQIQIIDTNH
jgi:hypothetical protein